MHKVILHEDIVLLQSVLLSTLLRYERAQSTHLVLESGDSLCHCALLPLFSLQPTWIHVYAFVLCACMIVHVCENNYGGCNEVTLHVCTCTCAHTVHVQYTNVHLKVGILCTLYMYIACEYCTCTLHVNIVHVHVHVLHTYHQSSFSSAVE